MSQFKPSAIVTSFFLLIASFVTGPVFASGDAFSATLSGAQEVPGVTTPASGKASARFDKGFSRVEVKVEVKHLPGSILAAHFHCALPGNNGPVAFGLISPGPLMVEDNRIRGTLTNDNFSGSDCVTPIGRPVSNIAALAFAMREGLIYLNIHTTDFGSGELRGQMQATGDD